MSYGDGENFAHRKIAEWAEELSLEVTHDYAGNQYATLPGRDRAAPRARCDSETAAGIVALGLSVFGRHVVSCM